MYSMLGWCSNDKVSFMFTSSDKLVRMLCINVYLQQLFSVHVVYLLQLWQRHRIAINITVIIHFITMKYYFSFIFLLLFFFNFPIYAIYYSVKNYPIFCLPGGFQHLSEVVFSALVGFHFKENDGFRVVLIHQWSGCSWNRGHCLESTMSCKCTGTTRNPSFPLQWKSDDSTKHYLT